MATVKPDPFELVDFAGEGSHRIHITGGKFEGVVYEYEKVKFDEVDDCLLLAFHTVAHEKNGHDLGTNEFSGVAGDILVFLLEEHLIPDSASE